MLFQDYYFVLADKDKLTEGTTRGSKVYAIMLYIVTVIFINKSQVNCLNIYIYIHGAVWFFFSMLGWWELVHHNELVTLKALEIIPRSNIFCIGVGGKTI